MLGRYTTSYEQLPWETLNITFAKRGHKIEYIEAQFSLLQIMRKQFSSGNANQMQRRRTN